MDKLKEIMTLIPSGKNTEAKEIIRRDPNIARQKTEAGISLLQFSIYCRNREMADYLLPLHGSLNIFEAASLGDLNVVREELKANAALLNAFAPDGFTPLGLACFFNHLQVARFLLEQGADPNIASRNAFKVAPIHSSTSVGSIEITELLLQHGANVNARQQQDVTPLHQAGHSGNMALTKILLDHGADTHAKTSDGKTPVDMANEKGYSEVAEMITQYS